MLVTCSVVLAVTLPVDEVTVPPVCETVTVVVISLVSTTVDVAVLAIDAETVMLSALLGLEDAGMLTIGAVEQEMINEENANSRAVRDP